MSPTQYVEGEEEQLLLTDQLVREAQTEFARLAKRPVPERVTQLLHRLARESFRLGYQHAHDRHTVRADPWEGYADEDKTK